MLFPDHPHIPISSKEALHRMRCHWTESILTASREADEENLRYAFRKMVLKMADESDPHAAELVAQYSFEDLRRITSDDYWSFERFCRRVRRYGAS